MPRMNIWVPDEIKNRIDEYNKANAYFKLNVSKIAQDAINEKLSEVGMGQEIKA